jgi:HEAT repeat protein
MQWWTVKQLKSKSARARLLAVEKLGTEGETALVEPLVPLLADPEAKVRTAAAEALGRIQAEIAIEPLAVRLAKEPEADARRAMVKSLQAIGSSKGIPALVGALGDPVGEIAWQAAKALQVLRWNPATDTQRAAWHLAVSQFEDAISFGSAAVEPLTKLTQGVEFHRCIRAVEALAKVGGAQAVKPLLDALYSKDFTVRSAAATALGEVGDARAVDPLIHALRDQHHQVCLAACISLGKMGDQRAVEPLIKMLRHSAPDVRTAAVAALGKLRDSLAVMPVVEQLRDSDLEVREAAAAALGLIGDEKAIHHLVMSMTDSHSTVRQAAANSLRRIEPYWERSEAAFSAIPNLQAALKHKDYWVRHSAADVLKKLGISEAHESKLPLDSDGALQKRQAAQSVLKSMLNDRDREFRQASAEALGRIGLADSIAPLVERLSDSDLGVRSSAARSLEILRWQPEKPAQKARQLVALERWSDAANLGAEAADALAEALTRKEPRTRQRIIEALVQVGGTKAVAALRALATNPIASIREEATAALNILESTADAKGGPDVWDQVPVNP